MILKCVKKYSELRGMLLHPLLTEMQVVFLGTGEVLNTINELTMMLDTSIMRQILSTSSVAKSQSY